MNAHMICVALSFSLLVSAPAHAFREVAEEPAAAEDAVIMAADLVQAALQAEAEGDAAKREALLREALDKDPNYAPARWQSGYVRLNDAWVSLAASENAHSVDPRVTEYQQVRKSLAESPTKDLLLARWCQGQKLTEESEFHWLNVLRIQPNHEEALRALDVEWYNGRLVKRDQVAAQKREDFKASRNTLNSSSTRKRRCEAMIARWERAAGQGDGNLLAKMETDLAAEKSADIIPMLNILFGERSRAPRDPEAFQAVSLNWLKVLAKDPVHTKFLVLHAIGHPVEAVRIAAADELKHRPREDYVPLLLMCARFPVDFACTLLGSAGLSSVRYTLDIQGLESDVQIEHFDSLERVAGLDTVIEPFEPGAALFISGGESPNQAAYVAAWQGAASRRARAMKAQVDQFNAVSTVINERIAEALTRATGEDLEADPRIWQAWWEEYLCDYYELEQRQAQGEETGNASQRPGGQGRAGAPAGSQRQRPLQQVNSASNQYIEAPPATQTAIQGSTGKGKAVSTPYPWAAFRGSAGLSKYKNFRRLSCFKGSTLVWTITGPRPIEEILPGDRVLAQSPNTGELAYKVVQQVTKRDPTPMMKITVGDEEIVSTLGHPFWVIGKRWTMAKHLDEGSLLHTVSGPLRIESVEEIPAAAAWYEFSYNLEVDDFHTYFVGENQVLVHHLSMLSVLDEGSSLVPGL
ncbi:MAG: polymorphic toxin-type HINT domain-containing protein [Pirellulaceae bacterium]